MPHRGHGSPRVTQGSQTSPRGLTRERTHWRSPDEDDADDADDEVDGAELDVARDSDVPISTQIFWQIAYQIDSGRLLPGERLSWTGRPDPGRIALGQRKR